MILIVLFILFSPANLRIKKTLLELSNG